MARNGKSTGFSSMPETPPEEAERSEAGSAESLCDVPISIFLWSILEDLREIYDIDISDDELDLILLETQHILHIEDFLVTYIRWKDKIDINRVEAALHALSLPITALKVPERPEEAAKLLGEELCILDNLGFSTESVISIAHASEYADGAFLVIMLGRPLLTGALIRGMIEFWLKGLLIEHLRNRVLRGRVEERAYRDRCGDSVAILVRCLEDLRRSYGELELENLIGPAITRPESINEELGIRLPKVKLRDILYWLKAWGVFPKNLGLARYIWDVWRKLCVEVHGDFIKSFLRQVRHSKAVNVLLDELVQLGDILLLGLLNTIENTARSRLWRVDEEAWERWIKYIQEGELYYASQKIRALDTLRRRQMRRVR